jgi:hypothetical protein
VVVEREIVVPTIGCCDGRIVAGKAVTADQPSVVAKESPKTVTATVSTSGSAPTR